MYFMLILKVILKIVTTHICIYSEREEKRNEMLNKKYTYIAVVSVAKWPRPVHIFAGGDPKRVTSKEGNRLCKVTDVALPFDLLQGNQVIFGSISHSSLVCSSSGFVFCLFSPDVRIVSHRKKCVIIDPHFRKCSATTTHFAIKRKREEQRDMKVRWYMTRYKVGTCHY